MNNKRHEKIIELVTKYSVETQDELARMLVDAGFVVTQATVSRDIKKLGLIKVKTGGSHWKYTVRKGEIPKNTDKLNRVLRDAIVSLEEARNILVIKTVPGMAMAAAAALDSVNIPEIIGSIAGDDTIMCATKETRHTEEAIDKINKLIDGI